MNILIFGAGAIGGYFAARLQDSGHEVTVVARRPLVEQIQRRGLTLDEPVSGDDSRRRHLSVTPTAVTTLAAAMQRHSTYELIILGMKTYDVRRALSELAQYRERVNMLMTMQNGLGAEEMAVAQFGTRRVLACSVLVSASIEADGTIVVEGNQHGINLAAIQSGWSVREWQALFQQAQIETQIHASYREMKWSKLILNVMGNATSAILNWTPEQVYRQPQLFNLEMAMIDEGLAVMKQLGLSVVNLHGAATATLVRWLNVLPAFVARPLLAQRLHQGRGKMPSFHTDVQARKGRSEVIFYNGAIASAGWDAKVPTPVNTTLTEIVLRLVRGEVSAAYYDNQPERLLAAVAQRRQSMGQR